MEAKYTRCFGWSCNRQTQVCFKIASMLFCWIYLQIKRRKISTTNSNRSGYQIKNIGRFVTGLGLESTPICSSKHFTVYSNGTISGGKVNKHVDVCLVNLLKFARDQCFARMIQLTKGKANYRVTAIQQQHRRSLGLPLEKVVPANENAWNVESSDGKNIYEVQRLQDKCPETNCRLSCI